jgi:hypothetical protein
MRSVIMARHIVGAAIRVNTKVTIRGHDPALAMA